MAKRRVRYIDRWFREHPRLCIYLSRDDYERVREVAESSGKSVKDLFIEFVNNMVEFSRRLAVHSLARDLASRLDTREYKINWLRNIINYAKNNPKPFSWVDVNVPRWYLDKLASLGILRVHGIRGEDVLYELAIPIEDLEKVVNKPLTR